MATLTTILLLAALIITIVSGIGRCPLWIAVLLLCIVALLRVVPL